MESSSFIQFTEHECPDCGETVTAAAVSLPNQDNEVMSVGATIHAEELSIENPEPILQGLVLEGVGETLEHLLENND